MKIPAYVRPGLPDDIHMTKPISWKIRPTKMNGDRMRFRSATYATAMVIADAVTYIGTVRSWAVVVLYPSSLMMVGRKSEIPYSGQT